MLANIILKTFTAILISLLVSSASAQDADSVSLIIQNKMNDKVFRELFKQGIFEYQDKALPSFKLSRLDGSEFDSKLLLGKPTIVNFWFTSCAPCLEEIPILNKLKDSYSDEINFIAITFEGREEIAGFLERKPFNFIQLVDANDFIKELDVKTYPRTLITDENMVVKYMDKLKPKDFVKFEEKLRSQIDEVLKR